MIRTNCASETPGISNIDLAKAINCIADITQGIINRRGTERENTAPVSQLVILYACLDLDPATFFTFELWDTAWRDTRRNGTRDYRKALIDAVHDTLTETLPGDWRTGGRYTPDEIRQAASRTAE